MGTGVPLLSGVDHTRTVVFVAFVLVLELLFAALLPLTTALLCFSIVLVTATALLLTVKPHYGVVGLIFLVPMNNLRIGIYPTDVTLFNVFYMFHMLAPLLVFALMSRKTPPREPGSSRLVPLDVGLALFVFFAAISYLWSIEKTYQLFKVVQLLVCFLAYIFLSRLLHEPRMLFLAWRAWFVTGIVAALGVFGSLFMQDEVLHMFQESETIPFYMFCHIGNINSARGSGFAEPKYVSNFVAIAICYAFGQIVYARTRTKLKYTAVIACMVFCLLFAQCRASLAGLLLAVAFLMISCRPLRRRVITAAGTTGFVLTTVFTLFLSTQLLVRAYHGIVLRAGVQGSRYTAVGEGKVSMSVRFGIWEKIMDVVKQHDATLHGIGTGGSAYVVGTLPHAHGLYLSVFFDLGLIGVILLLIIAATILTQLIHVLWARDSEHRTLMIAYFAGLFALGLNSCIEFDFLLHMFWAYLALGQASYWYFQKQEAASASLKSNQHESRE